MIGDAVWNQLKSKDNRDAIKISRLAKSSGDVEWLVNMQAMYSKKC